MWLRMLIIYSSKQMKNNMLRLYLLLEIKKCRRMILPLFLAIFIFPLSSFSQKKSDLEETRNFLKDEKINEAILKYDELINDKTKNTTPMMEYAYALALGGLYENALMYLDRAILLETSMEIYFYVAQVFALMGYDTLAMEFWKYGAIDKPKWIDFDYALWQQKYGQKKPESINRDPDSIAFKRANDLAARGMFLQSLVLFQELIDSYPDQFFPYIGYSTVWENIGMYRKAAEELEKGIKLMQERKDATLDDALYAFDKHLSELNKKARKSNSALLAVPQYKPMMMIYGGGMFSNRNLIANARVGFYLTNSLSVSLNLGVSHDLINVNTYFDMGFSVYQRLKFFVVGIGLTSQFGNNSISLGLQTSAGFSFFLGKNKKSSLDILFDMPVLFDIDTGGEPRLMYGASIGQTFYLGTRKSNKK